MNDAFLTNRSLIMILASLCWFFSEPRLISAQDILITTDTTYRDTTITLDGNLTVRDGGSLTLDHATIQVNGTFDGQYRIRFDSTAQFIRILHSEIRAAEGAHPFRFLCMAREFVINNSTLRDAGWGERDEIGEARSEKGPLILSARARRFWEQSLKRQDRPLCPSNEEIF